MSIFIAGETNNTKKEDICTSFVFGTMELLESKIFLIEFLKKLDISISEEELKSPKFYFWKKLNPNNRRRPDVIIEMDKSLIYIENKVDSEANSAQLIDEFEDAKDNTKYNKKNTFLIYITNDSTEPRDILNLKDSLKLEADRVKWYSWKQMYDLISSLPESHSLEPTSKKLLSNLNRYLQVQVLKKPKPDSYGAIVAINPDKEPYRDDWLENVKEGKETIYNSHRVRDLEFPNQKILFYRAGQGIIGEATICDYYIDEDYEGKHFHDFRNSEGKSTFVHYPKLVTLKDLKKTGDKPIKFRTTLGISKEMYDKIRELSGLK